MTEIDLATKSQLVSNLKAELKKAKDAARVAREVAEATVKASYECGVWDTETRQVEEVVEACRDYCTESWAVSLNRAGVPADSELRRVENIFFLEDIREILHTVPPPEQLPTTLAPPSDAEFPKGAGLGK